MSRHATGALGAFLRIPNFMALPDQFTQPVGHQPRLFFGFFQFRQIAVAGIVIRRAVIAVAFESQQQFRARRWISGKAKRRALFRRAELQPRLRVVFHAADVLAHEQFEKRIHKTEQALAAAKIFRQRNHLAVFSAPALRVIAENFRVGQPETINALLYVADEETICPMGRVSSRAVSRFKPGHVRRLAGVSPHPSSRLNAWMILSCAALMS